MSHWQFKRCFEVTFTGRLTLTWQQASSGQDISNCGSGGDEESDGNLTWQSVALAVSSTNACPTGTVCIADPQLLQTALTLI